jgi:hypothetical protein
METAVARQPTRVEPFDDVFFEDYSYEKQK